ncbi:DUF554 domain-containing protein [Deinococcus deserti]
MIVVRGLQYELTCDNGTYTVRSTLHGIAILALSGGYGIGVGFTVQAHHQLLQTSSELLGMPQAVVMNDTVGCEAPFG